MATAAELQKMAKDLQAQADEASREAQSLIAAAKEAERQEQRKKVAAESIAHRERMYFEIGQPLAGLNEAQHGIVYARAYDQGHAYGYSEVEMYYGELAEMARKLLDAN